MAVTFSSKHGAARFFPVLKIAGDAAVRAPVALNKAVCLIGRRWGVHLPLASKQVSKLHALIVKERDRVYIRDLASRNRVIVNGETVREADLGTGDVVRVGPYRLHCASGFSEPDVSEADAGRAAAASLEIDGGVSHVALDARAVLIGSRAECDIVLGDGQVSAVHAVIFELDRKRYVRDLDSAAGTFVNGERVRQKELELGDELRVGGTRLRYLAGDEGDLHENSADRAGGVGVDEEVDALLNSDEGSGVAALEDDLDPAVASEEESAVAAIDEEIAEKLGEDPDDLISLEGDPDDATTGVDQAPAVEGGSAGIPVAVEDEESVAPAPPHRPAVKLEVAEAAEVEPDGSEQLIPLMAGDRTVGVIDAAVEEAIDAPEAEPDEPLDSFSHIPLVPVGGRDSAVGGLPLPPQAAATGYGEFEDPADDAAERGGRKPLSPEETILPETGDDEIFGEPAAGLPRSAAGAATDVNQPAHPLFELVQQQGAATADAANPDHAGAGAGSPSTDRGNGRGASSHDEVGDSPDLADLLKLDGADAPEGDDGHRHPGRAAVRKLDRIVHELSDRVADLKSTWKRVKETRGGGRVDERPPASTDDAVATDERDPAPD